MYKYSFTTIVLILVGTQFAYSQEIIVGMYDNPPHMYLDKQGKPTGIFIEILNHIAQKENLQLKYKVGNADECYQWLDEGLVDMLAESGISDDHKKKYSMSDESESQFGLRFTLVQA